MSFLRFIQTLQRGFTQYQRAKQQGQRKEQQALRAERLALERERLELRKLQFQLQQPMPPSVGFAPESRDKSLGGNADGATAELAATDAPFCLACSQTFAPAQLVEVRECLDCRLQGFDSMVNGEPCPHCGSSSTRRVTYRGCPDCLEEVIPAD